MVISFSSLICINLSNSCDKTKNKNPIVIPIKLTIKVGAGKRIPLNKLVEYFKYVIQMIKVIISLKEQNAIAFKDLTMLIVNEFSFATNLHTFFKLNNDITYGTAHR